jgi:hypothetical protein
MAEWPCFEAFGGPSVKWEGLSGLPVWACGQGGGRVITATANGTAKNAIAGF